MPKAFVWYMYGTNEVLLSSDFGHPNLIFWYIKLANSKVSDISNFALTFKYALKIVLIALFRDLH